MEVAATISDILSENLRVVALPKDLKAVSRVIIKRKEVKKMETVQIKKNVFVPNQGWRRISLDEGESMDVIARVRSLNTSLMKVCLSDAEQMGNLSPANKVTVAVALFERLGVASFTAYQEELAEKVHLIRDAAKRTGQSSEQSSIQS